MACWAIESPVFQPARRLIVAITGTNPAIVTTSFDHDYITGEIVRLFIPLEYGMQQIHNRSGMITVTGATTFTIDIDSTTYDIFAVPVVSDQCAQVLPIGEINSMLRAAVKNVLPTGIR